MRWSSSMELAAALIGWTLVTWLLREGWDIYTNRHERCDIESRSLYIHNEVRFINCLLSAAEAELGIARKEAE